MFSILARSMRIASRTEEPHLPRTPRRNRETDGWLPEGHWWIKRNARIDCAKGAKAEGCDQLR